MNEKRRSKPFDGRRGKSLSYFTGQEIRDATDNFSKSYLIREDWDGSSYSGKLYGSIFSIRTYTRLKFSDIVEEVNFIGKLSHPNLQELVGVCEEYNCVVSEYLSGGSLQEVLDGKPVIDCFPLTWEHRFLVIEAIHSVMCYLHKEKIVHRDLSPKNILFDSFGTVKVGNLMFAESFSKKCSLLRNPSANPSDREDVIMKFFRYMNQNTVNCLKDKEFAEGYFSSSKDVHFDNDSLALGLIILQLCTKQASVEKLQSSAHVGSFKDFVSFLSPLLRREDKAMSFEKLLQVLQCSFTLFEMSAKNVPAHVGTKLQVQISALPNRDTDCFRGYAERMVSKEALSGDIVTAVQAVKNAAMDGSKEAQRALGNFYGVSNCGQGIDMKNAYHWLRKAAAQEHEFAESSIDMFFGRLCSEVKLNSEKTSSALLLLHEAALQEKLPVAQKHLADCYLNGQGVSQDPQMAFTLVRRAAETGDRPSQEILGRYYSKGQGVVADKLMAGLWISKSRGKSVEDIEKGRDIDILLGVVQSKREPRPVRESAFKELQMEAAGGNPLAQCALGIVFMGEVEGFPRDVKQSYHWLKKAYHSDDMDLELETKGELDALFALVFSDVSNRAPGDLTASQKQSLEVLHDAAIREELDEAQALLGRCYQLGFGAKVNEKFAVQLYERALGNGGHHNLDLWLGECYLNGVGVQRDREKGTRLLQDSVDSWMNKKAIKLLDRVQRKYMSPFVMRWRVKNVSNLLLTEEVSSNCFVAHGMKWKMTLYPKGCCEGISHVSVEISLIEGKPQAVDWESPLFKFTVALVNQKKKNLSREIECYKRFSSVKLTKTVTFHTPICDAFDPKIGYVKDDSLVVETTVQVEQGE